MKQYFPYLLQRLQYPENIAHWGWIAMETQSETIALIYTGERNVIISEQRE